MSVTLWVLKPASYSSRVAWCPLWWFVVWVVVVFVTAGRLLC